MSAPRDLSSGSLSKPDLDSSAAIADLVEAFYAKLLKDPQLAPIFLDVAGIDIREHFPRIRAYWEKLLLGDNNYHRHTMNIHRAVHRQRAFADADFALWLQYFQATVDEHFAGPKAERAKRLGAQIAGNMAKTIDIQDS